MSTILVPIYVYTGWKTFSFSPGNGLPPINNKSGTYFTDQPTLDAVIVSATAAGVGLVFSATGGSPPSSVLYPVYADSTGKIEIAQIPDLSSTYALRPWVNVKEDAYGAKGDGVTDDTASIQAALNATAVGGACYLPAVGAGLFYLFSTLSIPPGVKLKGAGWFWKRDNLLAFGNVGNTTRSNYGGSVLVSTAAIGSAISCTTTLTSQGGALEDVLIVGPGVGTSIGITLGSATEAAVHVGWYSVGVINFATGITHIQVEDSSFLSIDVLGCTTGWTLATATNNNTYSRCGVQKCTNGVTTDSSTQNNVWIAPSIQANGGIGFQLDGAGHMLLSPYFENPTATAALTVANGPHDIIAPTLTDLTDKVQFLASAIGCYFRAPKIRAGAAVTNAGSGNTFEGDISTLTDTGAQTICSSPTNGVLTWVSDAFSIGSSGQINRLNGATVTISAGAGVPAIAEPVGSIFLRTDGGASTTLYVKESGTGIAGWVAK